MYMQIDLHNYFEVLFTLMLTSMVLKVTHWKPTKSTVHIPIVSSLPIGLYTACEEWWIV